ncbi:MAG: peptidylprolyl isomerase, partial [Anaerolineales bacterium]
GEVLESSEGHDPLAYLHGRGNIVDGLEKALEGKSAGDKFNITLSPDEAYGSRDEAQVQTLPADEFAGVDEIEPGMQFNVHDDDGHHVITVTHVDGDQITVDGNHPLAGETLVFDVEVVGIREPTAEELSHGHVHGDGGHHH